MEAFTTKRVDAVFDDMFHDLLVEKGIIAEDDNASLVISEMIKGWEKKRLDAYLRNTCIKILQDLGFPVE